MSKLQRVLGLSVLLVGLVSLGLADEPKKGDPDEQEIKTAKKEKGQLATGINFNKALGLSFDSLSTLGARIDQARRDGDPVALANEANELAVAEKVSGKKASLTSEELWKQAEQLAEMRRVPTELKALSLMIPEDTAREKLSKLAEAADKREMEQARRVKAGERQKGITGTLKIVNKTDDVLQIYVNGFHVGWVGRFGTTEFRVGDPEGGQTYLRAESVDGDEYVTTVSNPRAVYTWVIAEG
jgi:regulator of replication initiation timing